VLPPASTRSFIQLFSIHVVQQNNTTCMSVWRTEQAASLKKNMSSSLQAVHARTTYVQRDMYRTTRPGTAHVRYTAQDHTGAYCTCEIHCTAVAISVPYVYTVLDISRYTRVYLLMMERSIYALELCGLGPHARSLCKCTCSTVLLHVVLMAISCQHPQEHMNHPCTP